MESRTWRQRNRSRSAEAVWRQELHCKRRVLNSWAPPKSRTKNIGLEPMPSSIDTLDNNAYISDYLLHWTGTIISNGEKIRCDKKGLETLSIIASTRRLLLSENILLEKDMHNIVKVAMTCFTDVPLSHSARHCGRYGHFAVAFNKSKLIKKGAQPVSYFVSHAARDMNCIVDFLMRDIDSPPIDRNVFRSLRRHFFRIKPYSNGRVDSTNAFYYEREWRIGELDLAPAEKLNNVRARLYRRQEGSNFYAGRLVCEGDNKYFEFDKDDVAFLVAPKGMENRIENPDRFPVHAFEELVGID